MKKYFNGLGILMVIFIVFSLFGCSEPSENGQNEAREPDTFVALEDINTHSIPVEQGMTKLLDTEEGMVISRYQGTFAFGSVMGHDIEFKKLGENNYSITYTAIDKDHNLETYHIDGNAENVFFDMMVENLQEVLNTAYKLEVTEKNSGKIFKYYYDIEEIEDGDLFNFVGMEAYSVYFLDGKGRFTGMERHSFYEIYDGEEHHDFIKKTVFESTD